MIYQQADTRWIIRGNVPTAAHPMKGIGHCSVPVPHKKHCQDTPAGTSGGATPSPNFSRHRTRIVDVGQLWKTQKENGLCQGTHAQRDNLVSGGWHAISLWARIQTKSAREQMPLGPGTDGHAQGTDGQTQRCAREPFWGGPGSMEHTPHPPLPPW